MRLIWAYNNDKPTQKISYHGAKNRGTKSVSLINFANIVNVEERLKNTTTIELRNSNVTIIYK